MILDTRKMVRAIFLGMAIFSVWGILGLSVVDAAIISKPATNLGLVGYWSMNEGTGSYAGDSSGNKNAGTLTNGPTWVDGKRGKALTFDGSNDYVQATVSNMNTTAGTYNTVAFWMYWNGTTNQIIVNIGNPYYDLWINSSTCFGFNTGNGEAYGFNPTGLSGEWHYITAIFYNGAYTGKNSIYVDGATKSLSQCAGVAQSGTAGSTVYLGTFVAAGYYFAGKLDDVRIYNRALSASEIQALYKSGAVKHAVSSNTGLVGYWNFNEGTGTIAGDSSGNKNTAVFPGGTANPTWVDGKRGKALNFDGGDYISFSNPINQANLSQEWTVAAWAKLSTGSGSSYQFLISGLNSGVKLMHGTRPLLYLNCCTDDYYMYGTTDLRDNKWHYVAFVFRNSDGLRKIYVDGRDDSSSGPNYTSTPSGMNATFNLGSQVLGSIDEVRIYNRALSAAEIQVLYKSGSAKFAPPSNTGLVGYWSFDDGSGTSATDFSGKNNAGVFPGGTANPTWVDGKRGKALNFDGSNDYVNAGTAAGLDLTSTFTIAVWVKSLENSAAKPQGIIVRANYAGFEYGWMLDKDTANVFHFRGNGSAGTTYTRNDAGAYSDMAYSDQNWHHLIGVNTGGKNYLYVDGVLQTVSATEVIGSAGGTRPVVIGHRYSDLYTTEARTWKGLIDDVRIYNRALSASEVQALYDSR